MKYFFSALLFLVVISAFSQHTITGTLIDKDTNTPLEFASIYLPQLEKGTTSDANGQFTLTEIPTGNHKIIVSMVGFETLSQSIQLPLAEALNLVLKSSAIEMEEVIVSTPFHKLQSENVMKVERESISELKQGGAANLASGITEIAGVESVSTGLSIGKPVIRGLSSNRVLVYAQGIRLENQQFGAEHGLGVNDAGIESVEIIKGPASLLYGSDALGGVLYLNPEKYAPQNSNSSDFNGYYFSNTKGYTTNVGYKSSGEAIKFLFRGGLAEHSDYDTENYRVTNTRFREQDFKAGIGYQKSNFKTDFRYNVNHSKLGIPEEVGEQSTARTPLLPYQDLTNHIFSSKSTLFFNESSLDFNLGYTYNDRKEFEEHHEEEEEEEEHHEEEEALEPALHMKLQTANYDVKYNLHKMGKFETIVGMQGMHQTNTNNGEEQLIPDATTNDFGFLATSHIHFETVDIQLGARYDNRNINVKNGITKSFNSFNGAIGARTNINKIIIARLNLATGFRAPNLAELTSFGTHEGTNRFEIGNANLNNEQNVQVDLALEFKNEHLEIFANGFYNNIKDYIYLSPDGNTIDGTPVYNYLQENASLYGGEFGFHLHPHPLDWLHFESSFETVTGKQDNDSYLPLIPANSLTNTIRMEFEKQWISNGYAFVKLKYAFKQNNVSGFETPTEAYSLLSAGFGGDFKVFRNTMSFSVSGNNLTNKSYVNHLSRLKADNIANIGRNFSIGISYRI